mgnify:CR=1 FL=1
MVQLLTERQIEEHNQASYKGAAEGAIGGTVIAAATGLWANRRFPAYKRLPPSLKLLGAIIIVAPCIAIQGERRGLEYDRSQWYASPLSFLLREARG